MVLDPGNMEIDQISEIQGHLALTMWMLPYEVMGCFYEYDSVLLEPLIASYLVHILFYSVLKTISILSHASPFHCLPAYVVHRRLSNIRAKLTDRSQFRFI